jgi:hypothetical protein
MTKGYVERESTLIMSEQQALNYANVLSTAVTDVKSFRNTRQNKAERAKVAKEVNNQDCV